MSTHPLMEHIPRMGRLRQEDRDPLSRQSRLTNLLSEIDYLRDVIQTAIDAIDCWKSPMYDPDGQECSDAVIRLLRNDLQEVLHEDHSA